MPDQPTDGHSRPRLVVGVDDTDGSREALGFAASHFPHADVFVVTADDREEIARHVLEKALEKEWSQLAQGGAHAQTYHRPGDPATVVLELAKEANADLIVMGRSSSPLERVLLGSVAANVAKKSDRPVLIVRGRSGVGPLKVLVTSDGSELAMRAVAFTARHLSHLEAEVRVLVVEAPEVLHPMRALEQASGYLAARGFLTVGQMRYGQPGQEILQAIEEERPDLLVMGSRGLSGMSRIFLGSVSEEVISKAHCSVLVVH